MLIINDLSKGSGAGSMVETTPRITQTTRVIKRGKGRYRPKVKNLQIIDYAGFIT